MHRRPPKKGLLWKGGKVKSEKRLQALFVRLSARLINKSSTRVYTFSVISETDEAVPPTAMRVCR
ncbi:hypothetical protein COCC4DRAFT_32048 [Bipolaris maydis ATCC 48331]|uniref:Uncharacterized protein n=2 Tax=Cochliobolus heterostrophus TaxID=5016 RepID=M2UL32_COCH5|nr:uncharacterized protein COCC4DRAFT_32048 [Bipolaris maydis ATCC 48331]EMD88698.1 hypothetical protein COCHEDRAFT_1022979 [Bipolaris maydis C5]ENI05585.1 hypothetical protein COCC4DRAFT_32048 [Bipolaris maydis ATCC 48331]